MSRRERGSAVPFAVACLGLVLLLGAALGAAGAMVADHRRAQGAADLAALAGAADVAHGGAGCAAAGRIASDNGAALSDCRVEGAEVRVSVVVTGPRWLGDSGDLMAEARAGPG
ncbi:helicase/secretion neighborhood TadE-like protein [Nocardioides terrae]|uniref:Helicase/secretion neighborhood TadE-like protein n=1 Tax=Nocardioides terrae TaxID=574651 RepID=A0A1I1H1Y5_9ACTN|nr:Rv3654c family TadE-like protein [Nocardioides terrae]SFC17552.1 helicase/secretion neighborhood TadE-like protein [Nocardioides terrae]